MLYFTDSFNTSMLAEMSTMTIRALGQDFSDIVRELKNMNFAFKVDKIQKHFSELFNADCSNTSTLEPVYNSGDVVYVCQPIDKHGRTTRNTYSQKLELERVVEDNASDLDFNFFRVSVL